MDNFPLKKKKNPQKLNLTQGGQILNKDSRSLTVMLDLQNKVNNGAFHRTMISK